MTMNPPSPPRVLVTGASSGVGEAVARLFAQRGCAVALLARRKDALDHLAEELGGQAIALPADVSDAEEVARAVGRGVSHLGGFDVAVNAAGIAGGAPLEELTETVWREVLDTNLTGTFLVSREVGLRMRRAGSGSIVNIASDLASMGAPDLAHYCAAKAGVVGLTRALALELAPHVRVNSVCPGPIDTPMLRSGLGDEASALGAKEATVPLGRLADPAEVARAVYFLAVEGTFATGTNMAFDGGTTAA